MKVKQIIVGLVIVGLVTFLPRMLAAGTPDNSEDSIVLTSDNLIVLNSQIDGESVSKLISDAKKLDDKLSGLGIKEKISGKKAVYLFLNTPGGSVQSGLEMLEALQGLGRPIHTITLYAASMGFQVAQNLEKRYIIQNGVLMSHNASGEVSGEFGGQSPSQMDNRQALWKSRLDDMDLQTVKRTNGQKTLESYQKQYSKEMWLTGSQSVAQGYADKVVKVKCDSSLVGTTTHETTVLIFRIQYDLDNCPLNTNPMNIRISFATNKNSYMSFEEFAKAGGQFGSGCLIESGSNKERLCALDTTLNIDKFKEVKNQFLNQYVDKMRRVVDFF